MRKGVLMGVMACLAMAAGAQTRSEWFRQKKTQIKYLGEQIATLALYKSCVEKGYAIAKNGLHAIGDIKDRDLSMHKDYLASLRRTHPAVKSYWKIAGATALQTKIVTIVRQKKAELKRSNRFAPTEVAYTEAVFTALLTGVNSRLEQLLLLTRDGTAEMTDDERLTAIDKIYSDLQDNYAFVRAFAVENSVLAVQRLKEAAAVNASRSLLNIH